MHSQQEENIFFPAIEAMSKTGKKYVTKAEKQHARLDKIEHDVDDSCHIHGKASKNLLKSWQREYMKHLDYEEQYIAPLVMPAPPAETKPMVKRALKYHKVTIPPVLLLSLPLYIFIYIWYLTRCTSFPLYIYISLGPRWCLGYCSSPSPSAQGISQGSSRC
eukprot:TRINITY_DN1056_c0_g1_i13.p1 TRINITY_DN1056_c0_g1~~TRINITY_DN1056_c0_g1_i13.p1  ORF type:complete len:162 (+),score=27.92 TRINITY_DN1056_c0_g1_i13:612-1097(+)